VGGNSLKLYDKGSVLRSEVTINANAAFKVYRRAEGDKNGKKTWRPMRRGVADMPRRAEASRAASGRHLEALAQGECAETLGEQLKPLCRRCKHQGKAVRGLRMFESVEMACLGALNKTEGCVQGIRHRDMREAMRGHMPGGMSARQLGARVGRMLRLYRAHGLLRKVSRTHRYQVTPKGRKIIAALLSAANASPQRLLELIT
jgi:hypothetical protein